MWNIKDLVVISKENWVVKEKKIEKISVFLSFLYALDLYLLCSEYAILCRFWKHKLNTEMQMFSASQGTAEVKASKTQRNI